jgi:hypothetical protein
MTRKFPKRPKRELNRRNRELNRALQRSTWERPGDAYHRRAKWTPLSCRSFAANAVRVERHALADNFRVHLPFAYVVARIAPEVR